MRKFILFYIAIMLSFAPLSTYAEGKRSHKHKAHISKKHKVSSKKRHHKLVSHKNKAVYAQAYDGSAPLQLASSKVLVVNQLTGEKLFEKNTNQPTPIASVTKLMTAMVMLDAHLPMDEVLAISNQDVDYLKGTHSRLSVGTELTRGELLQLALMSSENRAASALGRNYPGGMNAFLTAMNRKAAALGMNATQFYDATGLDSSNVSTAEDLAKMVNAAYHYPEIRQVSTAPSQEITLHGGANNFVNTNALVRRGDWVIGLSKTGFINEAGRCLVMQAEISGQPMIIVLLNSVGKMSRIGDANRIRKWIEHNQMASLDARVNG